ncbi:MAG: 50S ribosomal protein L21 [Planctomycetes bacterium]|nr:50S ribosomal protein L21 [Planctomycetota bacterium]
MYAIIADGGRQYRVEEGQNVVVDYRDAEPGSAIQFDRVLAVSNGSDIRIGKPTVAGVTVTAQVVGAVQGEKLTVQKFRRRKNLRRRTGHRQIHTSVRIEKIAVEPPA